MKILHVYKRYLPDSYGGVEQTIFQLARQTARKGVRNTVLCLSETAQERLLQREEALVVRCPVQFDKASTPFSLEYARQYRRLAAEADVLHYHFPYPVQDLLHLLNGIKKPSIITYHSDIVRQKTLAFFYAPLMHLFLNRMQAIVATSDNYLHTSPVLRRHRGQATVIPIGLSRESSASEELTQAWRERVGQGFFFFVGVFRYYKGLHFLLKAAAAKRWRIVLAGSGPLEPELKKIATDQGLDNVTFVGRVSEEDKDALYSLCSAIVFPSHLRSEAFGVTLVEGAMRAKPLISAEVGAGASYINLHGQTGLVIPPADPDALAQAMDLLQDNPELARTYGKNAALRYEKLFTAERMAENYLALYERALAREL
jgi:rhamnosyl/mannosyltransferase